MNGIKLGICQWSLPIKGPYGCKLASELGFDGVQLNAGTYERGFPLARRVVQEAYLEVKEESEITFPSIAVPELDNFSMTAPKGTTSRGVAIEAINKAIQAAEAMEIPLVMLPSFGDSDIRPEGDFKRGVEVLKYACNYALDRGVAIGTENLLSVEGILNLLEKVDKPNLKPYFDTQNHYLHEGYHIPRMLERLLPSLHHEIHVKDGQNGDLSGALLGEGDTNFYESMEVLKQHNYSGWLITENYYDQKPLSEQNNNPVELIKEDLQTLKEIKTQIQSNY